MALAAVYAFGRWVVPAVLHRLEERGNSEAFAMTAVAAVIGAAWAMLRAGLSSLLAQLGSIDVVERDRAEVALWDAGVDAGKTLSRLGELRSLPMPVVAVVLRFTQDGAPGGDGALVGNLPLVTDRLALRAVAYRTVEGGYIDDARRGRTVIFATHYLEEADAYADRIVLMARGTIVADGPPTEVQVVR